jgi:hypothetical protein
MRLTRQAGKNKTKTSTHLFDKSPVVSWNAKTKEITLGVDGVPHETPSNSTRFDYFVSLTIEELQAMIGSLANQAPK